MDYNIFEYKSYISAPTLANNIEIKINTDGTIMCKRFSHEGDSLENTYKLTNESIMNIKKVIDENKNIFHLNFYLKYEDEIKGSGKEFFFSNGEENIRIKNLPNVTDFRLPNTTEIAEIEAFENEISQKMMLLKLFFKICNILKKENFYLDLENFYYVMKEEELENLFTEMEKTEKERQKILMEGLTDARKLEIEKELKQMKIDEIENEIENMSNDLENMLEKGINNYWDCNYFEDVLFESLGGKYVVDTCSEIKEDLKNRYDMIIRKIELILDFCEKYYISDSREWELKRDTLFMATITNNSDDKEKKYELASRICEENNALYEGYEELYKKAINLYLKNDIECEKYINQLKERSEKIKSNIEKISADN